MISKRYWVSAGGVVILAAVVAVVSIFNKISKQRQFSDYHLLVEASLLDISRCLRGDEKLQFTLNIIDRFVPGERQKIEETTRAKAVLADKKARGKITYGENEILLSSGPIDGQRDFAPGVLNGPLWGRGLCGYRSGFLNNHPPSLQRAGCIRRDGLGRNNFAIQYGDEFGTRWSLTGRQWERAIKEEFLRRRDDGSIDREISRLRQFRTAMFLAEKNAKMAIRDTVMSRRDTILLKRFEMPKNTGHFCRFLKKHPGADALDWLSYTK
ncbi:hypothetical protein [Pseudovibrio brasiliensis]|uniref:Uncharacterized protein n=1 Tax=Pseudovibrio brasiliensis TaxID=1898042 RepID=A0ABX8AZH2_9HYPH|nr:hypothetical protein [Pseudovibrio brasiliensis]QUS59041.1 hypothetical protein KGB56_25845 [Pseudovibrio brasiliensis]